MTFASKKPFYITGAVFFLVLGSLGLNCFFSPTGDGSGTYYPCSAAVGQKNVFPTQGATLLRGETYAFTTGLRNDAAWNCTFEGGNLTIKKSGIAYSTQYLLEAGSFNNCSYSFQDELSGAIPTGWTGDAPGVTFASVVDSRGGHQKVVELMDNDGTVNCSLTNAFPGRQNGTIEFWVRKTVTNQESSIMVGDTAIYIALLDNGTWGYIDDSDTRFSLNGNYQANTWYHVVVDFENSTGGYKGLGQGEYTIRIDGITLVNNHAFRDASKWIERLTLVTGQAATGVSMQVDAVDYSWSPSYSGNRSAYDMSPMGFFNATDSFENEVLYCVPSEWTLYPGWPGATCRVLPGDGGHHKITRFTGSSINTFSNLNYPDFGTHANGTIEAWLRNNSTFRGAGLTIGSGGNIFFNMANYGEWGYFAAGTWNWVGTGVYYSADVWQHVRVEFECTSGGYKGLGQYQWNGYLNGVKIVSAAPFRININAIDGFNFGIAKDTAAPGYNYLDVDAVDFSWDPAYFPERSSYALVQLPQLFSQSGSYSFLYTLNSSSLGFSGSWVDFTVAEEHHDEPGPDWFVIIIWVIGSVAAVTVTGGLTIQRRQKKSRAIDSGEFQAREGFPEDSLFLASARMVQVMIFQITPMNLSAIQKLRHVDNPVNMREEIKKIILDETNWIVPCDNHRIEIQNSIFYITCRLYTRQNFALVFASTDGLRDSFFPILDSAIDLQFLKDHELIDHPDILLKYLVETLHLERSFDYNVAVPAKMNVLQSSALWKSTPTSPRYQGEVEEDLKSMTTSDARAAANYLDSLKESFEPDDN